MKKTTYLNNLNQKRYWIILLIFLQPISYQGSLLKCGNGFDFTESDSRTLKKKLLSSCFIAFMGIILLHFSYRFKPTHTPGFPVSLINQAHQTLQAIKLAALSDFSAPQLTCLVLGGCFLVPPATTADWECFTLVVTVISVARHHSWLGVFYTGGHCDLYGQTPQLTGSVLHWWSLWSLWPDTTADWESLTLVVTVISMARHHSWLGVFYTGGHCDLYGQTPQLTESVLGWWSLWSLWLDTTADWECFTLVVTVVSMARHHSWLGVSYTGGHCDLYGLVERCPPRERETRGSNPILPGRVTPVTYLFSDYANVNEIPPLWQVMRYVRQWMRYLPCDK